MNSSADGDGPDDMPADELEAGRRLHQQGRLSDAQSLYAQVLAREPRNAEALQLMGLLAIQGRNPAAAVDLLSQALQAAPHVAGIYSNRAVALAALDRLDEALADYDRAIALQPDFPETYVNRANALARLGRLGDALLGYEAALALRPDHAAAALGRADILGHLGRHEDAAAAYDLAAGLNSANPVAHYNRGNVLRVLRRTEEAIAAYDRAVELDRDFAVAHHNRAFCLLQRGDFAEGWRAYEWRRRCPTFDDPRYGLDRLWTGEQSLAGKTLYVFPELFLGDMLQFCRYAVSAERLGARVVLGAPASMHELLQTLSPSLELIAEDAAPAAFDYQIPLLSLPGAFGADLSTLPGETAYLRADPGRAAKWKARIGEQGLRIGVVWQGSTLPYALPLQRSYPLAALYGISQVPGVRLVSLQKHNGLDQLERLPASMAVETLGDDFDPGPQAFVDTAAAMTCCDLVIAMDTSAAHLAGALGVPTWLALPYVADWRWLADRDDSPWYPSMRLFRQEARGDWAGVFARMESLLRTRQAPPSA